MCFIIVKPGTRGEMPPRKFKARRYKLVIYLVRKFSTDCLKNMVIPPYENPLPYSKNLSGSRRFVNDGVFQTTRIKPMARHVMLYSHWHVVSAFD